jgi:hypothetical protein
VILTEVGAKVVAEVEKEEVGLAVVGVMVACIAEGIKGC